MIDGLDDNPPFGLAVRIMDSIDPALLEQVQTMFTDNAVDAAARVRDRIDNDME